MIKKFVEEYLNQIYIKKNTQLLLLILLMKLQLYLICLIVGSVIF